MQTCLSPPSTPRRRARGKAGRELHPGETVDVGWPSKHHGGKGRGGCRLGCWATHDGGGHSKPYGTHRPGRCQSLLIFHQMSAGGNLHVCTQPCGQGRRVKRCFFIPSPLKGSLLGARLPDRHPSVLLLPATPPPLIPRHCGWARGQGCGAQGLGAGGGRNHSMKVPHRAEGSAVLREASVGTGVTCPSSTLSQDSPGRVPPLPTV